MKDSLKKGEKSLFKKDGEKSRQKYLTRERRFWGKLFNKKKEQSGCKYGPKF
jgi:hypothetical protein